jgi:uncharacterized protein YceK
MRLIAVLFMVLLLSGCDGPRTTVIPKADAMKDTRVLRVRIVHIYDNKDRDYDDELNISHVLDVDVLDGPDELIGKPLALPYDLFYTATPPPRVGEVVVTTPSAWVTRNPGGKSRGFGQ